MFVCVSASYSLGHYSIGLQALINVSAEVCICAYLSSESLYGTLLYGTYQELKLDRVVQINTPLHCT